MAAHARPNFLLFITDQHRADHVGCYGNPIVKTQSIDGLAAAGLRFAKFYVACPICMPNRIVLMTGRMPTVNGSRHNGIPLDTDAVTFVDLLRSAGYRTALIGKSHLQDMTSNPVPSRIEAKAGLALPADDLREASRRRRSGPAYEVEIGKLWAENPNRPVPSPYYGFEHVRFANGHGDQVHGHYNGWLKDRVADPDGLRGIALTYGMITMVDDAIGRILRRLRDLGLDRNTVVVFTSDHGDFMGDHGLMLKHGLHFEGVIRVPFIWCDPEGPAGRTTDLLSGTIDIGTTVLARAGLAPFHGSQGFDIVRAATDAERLPRLGMIIEEDELGIHLGRENGLRTRTFVTERWQLTLWDGIDEGALFDRDSDPEQMRNLWYSEAHESVKHELTDKMLRELIRLGDTAPLTERVA
jgi:arylsulfatase A-like enzyme